MEFNNVPPESVDVVWPHILPMVERGLRHGQGDSTTSEHIRDAIKRGTRTLWIGREGDDVRVGVIFSVLDLDACRKLFVYMLGGRDMDAWAGELTRLLNEYKTLVGATCIEGSCRRGLARRLKRRGWKEKAVIMEFDDV